METKEVRQTRRELMNAEQALEAAILKDVGIREGRSYAGIEVFHAYERCEIALRELGLATGILRRPANGGENAKPN